jgi:hypothetical protein
MMEGKMEDKKVVPEKIDFVTQRFPIKKTENGRYLHTFKAIAKFIIDNKYAYAGAMFEFTTASPASNNDEFTYEYELYFKRAREVIAKAIQKEKLKIKSN